MLHYSPLVLACVTLFAVLHCGTPWTEDDEENLDTGLELDEMDFEDDCKIHVIPYVWGKVTVGEEQGIDVLEPIARSQREKAKDNAEYDKEYASRTPLVARKLAMVVQPGDVMLSAEKYAQLLVLADDVAKAISERRVVCEASVTCNVTSRDPNQLLAAWEQLSLVNSTSAEMSRRYADTLMLAADAATANGSPDVESYWLMLSDLEDDGYQKASTLWSEVRPLYQKLHRWVAKSLLKQYGPNVFEVTDRNAPATRIPAYLLGSPLGDDWSPIASLVLTNECKEVYDHILASLQEKKIVGKSLYSMAEKMAQFLGVGKLTPNFWEESLFNSTCPARSVDPCRSDPRVAACNITSWTDFLDAHEITLRSIHSHLASISPQEHTYLLKNGNRESAVEQAVAGLATLIAGNRHYLAQRGLLNLDKNTCVKDALYILLALRILPKLPYYLVADLARLEAIKTNRTNAIGKIWGDMRLDDKWQGLSTPEGEWWGFLEDPHIASNKPYISHFYGALLQFQLFEELLMRDESTSDDAEEFIRSRDELRMLLELGRSKKWPVLLKETFGFTGVNSKSLLRFFNRLDVLITPVPKVPKEARPSNPEPQLEEKDVDPPQIPTFADIVNSTLSDADVLLTNTTTETSTESDSPNVEHYLLIACGVVVAIAVLGVVVNYARKYVKKEHHYQRPVNQPA